MQGENLAEMPPYLRVLYYGTQKQGKSSAMAGAARLGRIIAIDFEGYGWLASPLRELGVPVENITVFKPRTFKEVEKVYWTVRGMLDEGDNIQAVCIDHMTELESILVRDAANERLARKLVKGEKDSRLKLAPEEIDEYLTDISDYGKWTLQATKITRWFRDLPVHVAFGAHTRTEAGKKVPDLAEKYRNILAGSVHMVCATHVQPSPDGISYVGTFRETNGWQGGDRLNVTKAMVVNPSFDRLILAGRGELDFNTDPAQLAFKKMFNK